MCVTDKIKQQYSLYIYLTKKYKIGEPLPPDELRKKLSKLEELDPLFVHATESNKFTG